MRLLITLFGILFFAGSSNELLKHYVLTPESLSELNGTVDCREDELVEEGLSLRECELMLIQLEISLESSPDWYRSVQLALNGASAIAALLSVILVLGSDMTGNDFWRRLTLTLISMLALDTAIFISALQTGPLLRAQYLWINLLWLFIHLSLIMVSKALQEIQTPNQPGSVS